MFDLNTILSTITPWFLNHGIRLVLIVLAAAFARIFGAAVIYELVRKVIVGHRIRDKEAERKRKDTLVRIFGVLLGIVIWLLAALMALKEIGFAIEPLLAAAGIAGLAFSFGGQYMIRDLIAGLFIIIENQYRIGDVVCFGGTCGLVEDISLRMTTLRDLDGVVHYVPHGEIKQVSNMSKGFARVNLDVSIAYDADLEQVISVVNRVGAALAADPAWQSKILKPPQFLRVKNFGASAITIKILGETKPLAQWDVAGELRKRLKVAFDKAGIGFPLPQRAARTINHRPKGGDHV